MRSACTSVHIDSVPLFLIATLCVTNASAFFALASLCCYQYVSCYAFGMAALSIELYVVFVLQQVA